MRKSRTSSPRILAFILVGVVVSAQPSTGIELPGATRVPHHGLFDLLSKPLPITDLHEDSYGIRIVSDSGKFSVMLPKPRGHLVDSHCMQRDPAPGSRSAYDLQLRHSPEGSWIRAHIGKRSNAGMPGILKLASVYARGLIVDYRSSEVVSDVSLRTYRGSVIYCGRVRNSHYQSSCSFAHVVLHGTETIRFYGLIAARTSQRRDRILQESISVLSSLELHEPQSLSIPFPEDR